MEWSEIVRTRRMVRDFAETPVDASTLRTLLDAARRTPSAGFTQGLDWIVLNGPDQTKTFWDHTLPRAERDGFRWPGLLRAPVLVLPMADREAYVDRYAETDKAHSGLGEGADRWPVPYWDVDAAMAAMALLYGVVDAGLGALFFGIFRNEAELLADLGVPRSIRPIGAIAIGHPTSAARAVRTEASPSRRPRRSLDEMVHEGRW
jgi:nitroreductase